VERAEATGQRGNEIDGYLAELGNKRIEIYAMTICQIYALDLSSSGRPPELSEEPVQALLQRGSRLGRSHDSLVEQAIDASQQRAEQHPGEVDGEQGKQGPDHGVSFFLMNYYTTDHNRMHILMLANLLLGSEYAPIALVGSWRAGAGASGRVRGQGNEPRGGR
jgi:hypothetical protein